MLVYLLTVGKAIVSPRWGLSFTYPVYLERRPAQAHLPQAGLLRAFGPIEA